MLLVRPGRGGRQDGAGLEHLGEHALHQLPALQHVGHAGRHPQVVLQDINRAVLDDPLPLGAGDDARHDAERPGAVDVARVAADREGDAHGHDGGLDRLAPGLQGGGVDAGQVVEQGFGGWTGLTVGADQFVVGLVEAVVLGKDVHDVRPGFP